MPEGHFKPQHEVREVVCWMCGQPAPTVWGFVRDEDEPDNHSAPCGKPCMAGGVPLEVRNVHDAGCSECTVQ